MTDYPSELLAQLAAMPEKKPADFTCAICQERASNAWRHSPKEYERPPICRSCENVSGYAWNGRARLRPKIAGAMHRDSRNANRIAALADALAHTATRQMWSDRYGSA